MMSLRSKSRPLSRRVKISLGVGALLVGLPALAIVALLQMDWNRARPWLNAKTSEALGRPFAISGDLSLHWEAAGTPADGAVSGWGRLLPWPHLVAKDIHIGNPASLGAAPGEMASIGELSFTLNPLPLLNKQLVIPLLSFDSPAVHLLRKADGTNNWSFRPDPKPSPWTLELQRLVFSKGVLDLNDAQTQTDIGVDVDTIDADPRYGMRWSAHGSYGGETVKGSGKAGGVLSLQHQSSPYPLAADLHVGATHVSIEGTLTKPTELAALDLHLSLGSSSMARLYRLTHVVLPETPAFHTEGHLIGQLGSGTSRWTYEQFSGKVGSSDIAGTLDYRSRQPRGLLSGKVSSHLLQFSDLGALIGADSNAGKAERGVAPVQPAGKLLPVEPFRTERWTSVDADVDFSAERIIRTKELPISRLNTHLVLKDGVLTLMPLQFDVAGGNLHADIKLDGSAGDNIKAELKLSARHLKLKQLFKAMDNMQATVGELNGDASLRGHGSSVAAMLGSADGQLSTVINQGSVSKLLLEEMGLNIGNVVLTKLIGDKPIKINCVVTDLPVNNGIALARSFVVDTDDALIDVSGHVNLAEEQLDLTIRPNSKGLRVISLRAPLYARGSFADPSFSVDKGVLALRAGGALALAAVAPVAALLPLVNAGPNQDGDCAKLIAAAHGHAPASASAKKP